MSVHAREGFRTSRWFGVERWAAHGILLDGGTEELDGEVGGRLRGRRLLALCRLEANEQLPVINLAILVLVELPKERVALLCRRLEAERGDGAPKLGP